MQSPSDFLLAAKRCELVGLQRLRQTVGLVDCIADLVHAMQRERGVSNLFLGAAGEHFAAEREDVIQATADRERAVRESFSKVADGAHESAVGMRLLNRVAIALHLIDGLPHLRRAVHARKLPPTQVIEAYGDVIGALLAVVFEAVDTAGDPAISRLLVALFHLIQGKELAGQERATGVMALSMGTREPNQARLAHLIDSEERCFDVFLEYADPSSLQHWQDLSVSATQREIDRLRRSLLTATSTQADVAAALRWFELTSQRIDAIRQIEQALSTALRLLCAERIRAAQADLRDHTSLLERIAQSASPSAGIAVFIDNAVAGAEAVPRPVGPALTGTGMGPQLGASLIDMLQAQSRRIESISDELTKTRAKLNESLIVERAAGLLMARQGLSAEQAHRLLRRTAMNQNKRLVDIAEATLSLVELMPTTGAHAQAAPSDSASRDSTRTAAKQQ